MAREDQVERSIRDSEGKWATTAWSLTALSGLGALIFAASGPVEDCFGGFGGFGGFDCETNVGASFLVGLLMFVASLVAILPLFGVASLKRSQADMYAALRTNGATAPPPVRAAPASAPAATEPDPASGFEIPGDMAALAQGTVTLSLRGANLAATDKLIATGLHGRRRVALVLVVGDEALSDKSAAELIQSLFRHVEDGTAMGVVVRQAPQALRGMIREAAGARGWTIVDDDAESSTAFWKPPLGI